MPWPPRFALVDLPQHVTQRGCDRQKTFFEDEDYHCYLGFLSEATARYRCDLHAYVLMPDHVHLLVTPRQPLAIPRVMQSVSRRYVRYVNDSYERAGTLWDGRYKASLVGAGSYLMSCYRFIESNPVRAGLVRDAADYDWSSHRRNARAELNALVTEHPDYTALGASSAARAAGYRRRYGGHLPSEEVIEIRRELRECRAYGSERFKDEIETLLGRAVRRTHPTRPPALGFAAD